VGVLNFDGQSCVEQLPMRGGVFFDTLPPTSLPDRTDMAAAVRMAVALFPHDTAKRIVLVSDGNNNVGDVLDEVRSATASGIGIDVVPLHYSYNNEIYVEKLQVPASAKDGDMVPLRALIYSRKVVNGTITITHDGVPLELPEEVARRRLRAGSNPIMVKVPVHGSGPHRFELIFRPDRDDADTIVENNRGTGFTFVGGTGSVLLLTSNIEDDAELVRALRKEQIEIDAVKIEDAEGLDLLGLMRYSTVILANVGANWFTDEQQEHLVTYVRDMGRGLIMTGGSEAFGAGGWIGSPVEDIMPVDFEIKHRKVIPRGALVIIMHSCEMPRGNYWGKRVAEKAVETISSKDYFGLLSFSHMKGITWDCPLREATNKTAIKQAIQRMTNGDMPDFKQTMQMAVDALMERKDAAQRHIIIISDGDAQPPSQSTIKYMQEKKITCSTVAIGYGAHVQEGTLRQIAKQTGGRFYGVRNPKRLPQIFVKESKVIRRPLLVEQPFTPRLVYAMSDLWIGFGMDVQLPPLGGLVMTSPKQGGLIEMPLVRRTGDGDDPVLAHWQVGLGRTVAFTSGYWPRWGDQWTNWAGFGKLWAQIVRWTMGGGRKGDFDIATKLDGNQGKIVVNALDKESNYLNFLELEASIVRPGGLGVERVPLTQVGPGRYEAVFAVEQTGQFVANITMREGDQVTSVAQAGLSVPYSPEYKELRANDALLEEIRGISGGKMLEMDPQNDDVFRHDLPPTRSYQPAWEWVLAWLVLPIFLLDVAFRRLASMVAVSIFVEVVVDFVL
ncbi:MAG: VWA domain-containing protein, partial [Planctomycetes bacterium]|nr:VWA domain-containing protein [Planctomycetota bacterium]